MGVELYIQQTKLEDPSIADYQIINEIIIILLYMYIYIILYCMNFCKMYILADHISKSMVFFINSKNRSIGNFCVLFFDNSLLNTENHIYISF